MRQGSVTRRRHGAHLNELAPDLPRVSVALCSAACTLPAINATRQQAAAERAKAIELVLAELANLSIREAGAELNRYRCARSRWPLFG